jgi:DNA polymerase III epsilon subunit-like protein
LGVKILDVLVVDIETASIDANKDKWDIRNCLICEIGIANLNLDSGKINPVFNQICREDDPPDPDSWVFKSTSLTCEMIAKSTHFKDLKDELQEILNEKPVTSWGHDFDLDRLECHPRCLDIVTKFWDPKRTLKNFLKIPSEWGYGYKWPSVMEALKYFYPKQKLEQNHRAIDDAKIEADIILQATGKWPILKTNWKDFVL